MNKCMKKNALVLIAILFFSASAFTGLRCINFVSANPSGSFPALAMPIEYVNYTIANINGTLWAKIDGDYPISILNQPDGNFKVDLPMVYPMPPEATNIHVFLDQQEINWTNYSQMYPDALHHTAIGDWGMIYCVLNNVSDKFVLKIHYEHPLQMLNGSYLFLYNLNIGPYLSEQSNNSTVYYTIRMETGITNLRAYTTATDSQWNPINFTTTKEGSTQVINIQEQSEYAKSLPGDLVVEFSSANQAQTFPVWAIPAFVVAAVLIVLIFLERRAKIRRAEKTVYMSKKNFD